MSDHKTFPGMFLAEKDKYVFSAPSMWKPFWKIIADDHARTIHNLWVSDNILVRVAPHHLLISFSANEYIELAVEPTTSRFEFEPKLFIYTVGDGVEVKLMLYSKAILDAIRQHHAIINPSIKYAASFKNTRETIKFLSDRYTNWSRSAPNEKLTDILRVKYETETDAEVARLQTKLIDYICILSKNLGARYVSVSPNFFVCMENVQFVKHHKNPMMIKMEPLTHHICEAFQIEGMRLDTGMITYMMPFGRGGVYDLTGDIPMRVANAIQIGSEANMSVVAERRNRGETMEEWLSRCTQEVAI